VTNYLITTYGQAKMNTLLTSLRDGSTADDALLDIYGFDVDGLDDAWRASIGAAPRSGTSNPTPVATPTVVPTIVPYSGAPAAPYAPTPAPTKVTAPDATATTDPLGALRAYATQTAIASAANATPTPKPSLAERLGVDPETMMVVEFALVCCVLAIAAVAGPILLTVRRKHRRKS
jgi:hypothetical protein